jgi:hypothetical protein
MTTELPQPPRRPKPLRKLRVASHDFANGPLIVTEPDTEVVLTENVTLNFAHPKVLESPNHLGFFGGIVIGADRVTINLNGKTLRMHPNFRARQRFFALISLDVTPFPPGKMKFTTTPKSPTDLAIVGPGCLGLTSHFAIHGNTLRDGRVLIADLEMKDFEVGAISISGASDVLIRNCTFGRPEPPTTTSDFLMLKDLAATAREHGADAEAAELMNVAEHRRRHMTSSDALVRAIVLNPEFNVNGVPDTFERRIHRIAIVDSSFDDLRAEPIEVVGATVREGDDKNVLKDRHGNLIAFDDIVAGAVISRMQAAYSPDLDRTVRRRLMTGPCSSYHRVRGLDRRGHSLQGKSSAFARIDGCYDVTLRNLRATHVTSSGPEAAAVGFMLNGCERVRLHHVSVGGAHVRGVTGGTNPLSDLRPQSGLLLRRCLHVLIDDYNYASDESCASALRFTENASMARCTMHAPSTFLKCRHVRME